MKKPFVSRTVKCVAITVKVYLEKVYTLFSYIKKKPRPKIEWEGCLKGGYTPLYPSSIIILAGRHHNVILSYSKTILLNHKRLLQQNDRSPNEVSSALFLILHTIMPDQNVNVI